MKARFKAVVCLILLPFMVAACQMGEANQGMMLTSIAGDALELKWSPPGPDEKVNLVILDQQGKKVDLEMELNLNSVKIKEIDPGVYDFRLYKNSSTGPTLLGSHLVNVKAARKSSQILKPEDFGVGKALGLQTLLAFSEGSIGSESQRLMRARQELKTVSRNLVELFLGPSYSVGEEEEVYDIEKARAFLLTQKFRLAHGFAARALLVLDLRLPGSDGESPCQLALRLFDIAHPNNKDEYLWNGRPLIYEDWVEIRRFREDDTNYDVFIRALSELFQKLCADHMVQAYCKTVKSGNEQDGAFTSGLWRQIGRRLPVGESREEILRDNYGKTEMVMFPNNQQVRTMPVAKTTQPEKMPAKPTKEVSPPPQKAPKVPPRKPAIPIFDPNKGQKPKATEKPKPTKPEAVPVKPAKPTRKPAIPIFDPGAVTPVKKGTKKPASKSATNPPKATTPPNKPTPKKSAIPIFDPKKVGNKKDK